MVKQGSIALMESLPIVSSEMPKAAFGTGGSDTSHSGNFNQIEELPINNETDFFHLVITNHSGSECDYQYETEVE